MNDTFRRRLFQPTFTLTLYPIPYSILCHLSTTLMTNLFLRYRMTDTDPWTTFPDITSAFPGQPTGSLPVSSTTIASEPLTVEPGAGGQLYLEFPTTDDDHLALRVTCPPIPLALATTILTFLMQYRLAPSHEAKHERFGQGGFISASLSLIKAQERNGMLHLEFRLVATMNDALINF